MMMPSVASCNKLLKDNPGMKQKSQTHYTTVPCRRCLTLPAVCLSFKPQIWLGRLVYRCAAHPRYSFCEVILEVRLDSRAHGKLDGTLKQNYNTNDFPKHL